MTMENRKLKTLLRHKTAMAGLGVLALILVLSAIIGWISPYDPLTQIVGEQKLGPSWQHLLGTDNSGRDIFTRLCYGARVSLLIGVLAVAVSLVIGIPMGVAAGYFGGKVDMLLSRLFEIMLSFPAILLAICIAASLGGGLNTIILSVGIVGIPQFARQVRASVLALKEQEFVTASRALGSGHGRIMFVNILPNALGPIVVLATLNVGSAILTAAGLSFLGLGVSADTPEWGAMLYNGYSYWRASASLAICSGMAISLTVLAFNLLGDGLRDALDPRST